MKCDRRIFRTIVFAVLFSILLTSFGSQVTNVKSMPVAQQPINDLDWNIEAVDGRSIYMGFSGSDPNRSMAIDSAYRIHLAYGLDRLYYGLIDGTDWTVETADPHLGGVDSASLALDSANNPHVSYCRGDTYQLMYAYKVGSSWIIETVDPTWNCIQTALALDSANNPHIAYMTPPFGKELKFAAKHGASPWGITTLFSDMGYGTGRVNLVINPSDLANISFYAYKTGDYSDLIFVREEPLTWIHELISPDISGDFYNSLALDPSGNPHATYTAPGGLYYASRSGGVWSSSLIIDPPGYLEENSLAFDSAGQPHAAYRYGSVVIGISAYNNQTASWTHTLIKSAFSDPIFPLYLTIDLNPSDLARVVYSGGGGLEIASEQRDRVTWVKEVRDSQSYFFEDTSLALNSSGQAFISYYDYLNRDLRMANQTGPGWNYSLLESIGDVGRYNAIALDADGWPIVGYYDETAGDLKLTYYDGYSWPTITIDSTGDVGQYVDMEVDSSGVIHLCYYDATNSRLKYASYHYSSPSVLTVDATTGTGKHCSLALDNSGKPYIAYYSANDGKVKLAGKPVSSWVVTEIVSGVGTSADVAIALAKTPQGLAVIYTLGDSVEARLYMRTCILNLGACPWSGAILAASDIYETYGVSMAFNSDSVGYIALREAYNEERLNVITCSQGLCSSPDEVDKYTFTNGGSSALVLDSRGLPRISYLDNYFHGVRYASVFETTYLPLITR